MHHKNTSHGMSLVEALIASAILVIVALGIGQYISQSHTGSIRIEASGQCRQVVEGIIQALKVTDNTTVITNHIPSDRSQLPLGLGQGRVARVFVDGAGQYFNFQNIQSTATILQQIYIGNGAACVARAGVDATTVLGPSIVPAGFTAKLKIAGHNLNSPDASLANCDDILNAKPNSNWGVDLTIEVSHTPPGGTGPETCKGSATVAYEKDTSAPTIALDGDPVYGSDGGGYSNVEPTVRQHGPTEGAGITNTLCGYTASTVMDVRVPLVSNEPGSLFKCAAVSAAGGPPPVPAPNSFTYCDGFTLLGTGAAGKLTLDSDTPSLPPKPTHTRALLTFTGVPEGKYRFYVKSVDTAGLESAAPALVFFTIDTTRPVWTDPGLILSVDSTNKAVGQATLPPAGSDYAVANDPHAALFTGADPVGGRPILYQCKADTDPVFVGTMSTQVGNELCYGETNQGQTSTYAVTGNQCRILLNHTPVYQVGRLTLSAEVRDICNASRVDYPVAGLPSDARGSATWLNDRPGGDPLQATHLLLPLPGAPKLAGSNYYAPIRRPKAGATEPRWNVTVNRSQPDLAILPVGVEFPRLTGAANLLHVVPKAQSSTNVVTGLPGSDFFIGGQTGSCRYDQGFCARAFTACGGYEGSSEGTASSPGVSSPFAIRGGLNDSCWDIPCEANLQCSLKAPTRGQCIATSDFGCTASSKWKCTNHSDCDSTTGDECMQPGTMNPMPWTNTVFNAGECASPTQPVLRICGSDSDCVSSDNFQGRCSPTTNRCTCHDFGAIGSIGAGVGNNDPKCPNSSVQFGGICGGVPANCFCPPATADNCVTVSSANSCGVPNSCRGTKTTEINPSTGIPYCGVPTSNTALTVSCPPVVWLGVPPPAPNDQFLPVVNGGITPYKKYECSLDNLNWRDCRYDSWPETAGADVWFKVTDNRDDYALSPRCTFKHDKTNPSLTVTVTDCGDSSSRPSLSSQIPLTLTVLSDNLSDITVTAKNMTRTPALPTNVCGPVPKTGVGCTTSVTAPARGVANDSAAQDIDVTATDEAGNSTTKRVAVYSPVSTGFSHTITPGDGTFTQNGFFGSAVNPYRQKLTSQFSNTNSLNFSSSMSITLTGAHQAGTLPANQWPGGVRNDINFDNDGLRSVNVTFKDACNVTSSTASTQVSLDWTSPQNISYSCDASNQSIDFSASDSESGVSRVKGTCVTENEGTRSINWTNGNSATITNIGTGTTHCTLDALDQVGNSTDSNDGYNLQRSKNATCVIATPTPTATPVSSATPGACIPNGNDCQRTTYKCGHLVGHVLLPGESDQCGDCCSGVHHFACEVGTETDCYLCMPGGRKICGPGSGSPPPTPTPTATPSGTPCLSGLVLIDASADCRLRTIHECDPQEFPITAPRCCSGGLAREYQEPDQALVSCNWVQFSSNGSGCHWQQGANTVQVQYYWDCR